MPSFSSGGSKIRIYFVFLLFVSFGIIYFFLFSISINFIFLFNILFSILKNKDGSLY